ncbi:MAG: bifunctional nuclease family protein [Patescibacteria group bacterium]
MQNDNTLPVDIVALVEEEASHSPIVMLHHRESDRVLPIWIGEGEARAIAIALGRVATPRPLTHSFLLSAIQSLGGVLTRVTIDRIEQNTYFATAHVQQGAERYIAIDSRPSDAIALAITGGIPIFVAKEVFEKAGQPNPFPQIPNAQSATPEDRMPRAPRKIELSREDIERMADVLKAAQQREQKA